ncbi:hypothetical protein PV325_002436 [Microctonus aethiopoides]|nr:hypothetical protein PV325_002436 [Microctonus aethiopoides]
MCRNSASDVGDKKAKEKPGSAAKPNKTTTTGDLQNKIGDMASFISFVRPFLEKQQDLQAKVAIFLNPNSTYIDN